MVDGYLYHGTSKKNLKSIKNLGLIPIKKSVLWKREYPESRIYLAETEELACSFAENSLTDPEDQTIVFRIPKFVFSNIIIDDPYPEYYIKEKILPQNLEVQKCGLSNSKRNNWKKIRK